MTPSLINFLTNPQDAHAEKQLAIRNAGKGNLDWDFKTKGSFFSAERRGHELELVLDSSEIGKFQGSVFISSNGGEKTVPVRALVKGATEAVSAPSAGDFADISGAWESAAGIGHFVGSGPSYQYQSTNPMGVTVEQGTAHVVGNMVTLQGYNIMTGNFSATMQLNGDMMSGTLNSPMGSVPIALRRSGGGQVLNALANLFS